MNKILRLVCRQADFKKLVSIGFFAAFLTVFLSAGTTQAGFFDWFNLNKASNDSQQAAAIADAKATSTSAIIKVISPNGGEVWKAGTKKNIVFKGNLIKEKVAIVLWWDTRINSMSIGEGITSGNGKTSKYSWVIPKNLEGRSDYEIFVAYKGREEGDSSDKTFTIKSTPSSSSSKSSSSRSASSSSSKANSSSSVPKLTKEIILQLLKDSLFDNKCSSEKIAGEYGSCSIDISKTDSKWIVTVTYNGLYDDSIKAVKTRATVMYQDKQWIKQNISKTQQCWTGRGHQDFSSKPCL